MINVVPHRVRVTINGKTDYDVMVDGPISLEQSERNYGGVFYFTASFILTRSEDSQPSLYPFANLDFQEGRQVNLELQKRDGSYVPLFNYHTLFLEKVVPAIAKPQGRLQSALALEAKCRLGYHNTRKRRTNPIDIDPDVGLSYGEVISRLLRSQGIIEGLQNPELIPDLIRFPVQKLDDESFIEQAGRLAIGAPGGPFYLYADQNGQVRLAQYSALTASPLITFTAEEVDDLELLNPAEHLHSAQILKLTGTELNSEQCLSDEPLVDIVEKTFQELDPTFYFGNLNTFIASRTTTTIERTDNTITTTVLSEEQSIRRRLGAFGGIAGYDFLGLANVAKTVTADTINASGFVVRRVVAVQGGQRINGILTGILRDLSRREIDYEIDYRNYLVGRDLRYFELLELSFGVWVRSNITFSLSFTGEEIVAMIEIGGPRTTWKEAGCQWIKTNSVLNGPSAVGGRAVRAVYQPTEALGSKPVGGPTAPEEPPAERQTRETDHLVCSYIQVGDYVPPHIRYAQYDIEYIWDRDALQNLARIEHDLLWGDAFGIQLDIPILDRWVDILNANNCPPLYRFDVLHPDDVPFPSGQRAYLWGRNVIDIELRSALIRADCALLGEAPSGIVSKLWNTAPCSAQFSEVFHGTEVSLTDYNKVVTIESGSTHIARAIDAVTDARYWEIHNPSNLLIGLISSTDSVNTTLGGANGVAIATGYDRYDIVGLAYDSDAGTLDVTINGTPTQQLTSLDSGLYPAVGGDGTGVGTGRLAIADDLGHPVPDGVAPYIGSGSILEPITTDDGEVLTTDDGEVLYRA